MSDESEEDFISRLFAKGQEVTGKHGGGIRLLSPEQVKESDREFISFTEDDKLTDDELFERDAQKAARDREERLKEEIPVDDAKSDQHKGKNGDDDWLFED